MKEQNKSGLHLSRREQKTKLFLYSASLLTLSLGSMQLCHESPIESISLIGISIGLCGLGNSINSDCGIQKLMIYETTNLIGCASSITLICNSSDPSIIIVNTFLTTNFLILYFDSRKQKRLYKSHNLKK